jgi:hypothetical protein
MRAVAAGLALVAIVCLILAIANMAGGSDVGRRSWLLRLTALACFLGAVVLNVIAHG